MYDQGKAVWPGPYCVPSGQSCLVRFVLCTIRTKLSGQVCIVSIRAKLSGQICIVYHQGKAVSPGLYCVPSGQNCLARSLLCTIRAKLSGQVCIVSHHQGKLSGQVCIVYHHQGKAVWSLLYTIRTELSLRFLQSAIRTKLLG